MEIYRGKYPILVLTGPRQSGKTAFIRNEFVNYTYVNLYLQKIGAQIPGNGCL